MPELSRRALLAGLALVPVAGCVMSDEPPELQPVDYGTVFDGGRTIPGVLPEELPVAQRRRLVDYDPELDAGRIVIDPDEGALYLTLRGPYALRYSIAVGRDALGYHGETEIFEMEEWPLSQPAVAGSPLGAPAGMPTAPATLAAAGGSGTSMAADATSVPSGPSYPLGARSLALRSMASATDRGIRIHGTPLSTTGTPTSSGYRMINQEIIDLYSRVTLGTRVSIL
ncbi:L,D-transpeptidase [Rhodobacter sp. NTK016B]|uniref:L,D-transpeptidase n=1 Tax=Rhodobacter sp. NTK016B TaxID=2759676 RepID=UPI001A908988|nr:L,D-transpeptidase [Rhodobacter sp. NTK016B]MBN8293591.1 L,D-transpeptidase [Rhodobacter sp. NTK016B]